MNRYNAGALVEFWEYEWIQFPVPFWFASLA